MGEQEITRKKKKKSKFWFGYRIYLAVLVVLIVIMCFAVWNTMKKYEAAQPERVIEDIVNKLEKGDVSGIKSTQTVSKFEPGVDLTSQFAETVKGKELTYKLDSNSYDSLAPIYDILDGEDIVARISIKSVKETKKMAILVLSDWEVTSIEPVINVGNYTFDITVPENYSVAVNGVEVGSDEQKGDKETLEGFDYVAEYVSVPTVVTYEITGLMNVPTLSINGEEVASDSLTVNENNISYTVSYNTAEISDELKTFVISAAERYSNYFSKDLEGCSVSTAPIADLFPSGSYYLDMAEQYRQSDMWMYSAHQSPVFSNEQAINYTPYSDNMFTVEVIFDKTMILSLNGQERVDHNDQIYYYVNIDGSWLIADMREAVNND